VNVREIYTLAKKITGITSNELATTLGTTMKTLAQQFDDRQKIQMNKFLGVMDTMGIGYWFRNDNRKIALIKKGVRVPGVPRGYKKEYFEADDENMAWAIWKKMLEIEGMRKTQFEAMLGYNPQRLEYKIMRRGSIQATEFLEMAEASGYFPVFFHAESGVTFGQWKQRKFKGMSEGVKYNTETSKLLASSFYSDGVNEFPADGKGQNLYIDSEGRYFMTVFSADPDEKPKVRAVSASVAEAFINEYAKY